MSKRLLPFIVLFLCITFYAYGQAKKTAIIKGKLINSATKTPFNDLKVSIAELSVFTRSDGEGNFELSEVEYGSYHVVISGSNAIGDTIPLVVEKEIIDLKEINITPNDKSVPQADADIPTISISDNGTSSTSDPGDDGTQSGNELLLASRDPFVQTAVHIFGSYFFRPRGDRGQNETEINGIPFNNAQTGFLSWSQQLGDLTDVFKGRDIRYGMEPSPFTFGSINGSTYIQATAADQQKETKITYTATDHSYKNKVMFTENSGLMKNGWAYSFSVNKRWAEEGYRPGTWFDGYAYYGSVSKVIKKSTLSLTTFGAPLAQARAAAMQTKEVYSLSGNNYYNPDWGYQTQGTSQVARESNIQHVFQPVTIFNYEYKPTDDTRWTTGVGYQFGKDRTSSIDDYNAASPYGNYYQNLPSYYLTMSPPNPAAAAAVRQKILADPQLLQIDWDKLYNDNSTNIQTINNVDGIAGKSYTGKQSAYVMDDRVNDLKKFTFNSNFEHVQNPHKTIYGGFSFVSQRTETYKQLTDLLGGDYFVNYNQFASQQYIGNPNYIQNNLNDPNQVVKVGDKYGYDYTYNMNSALLWLQEVYTYDRYDFFVAANVGNNEFTRNGFMRNGLFANNSYGLSDPQSFFNYAVKAGATYKIDRRNILFLNGAYTTTPPTPDNTFIAPSINNGVVSNPQVQRNSALEGGYLLKSSIINARAVGYVNNSTGITQIKRFYNDDPAYKTFVNYVMQNENTRSIGTELMLDVKLLANLNVVGVAAIGEAFYTNRPDINVYLDNDTTQHPNKDKAYIKNYYLGVGPQSAYTVGFNYRPKKYWYVNLNFNYTDRNYVEINPNRRTQEAADLIPVGSPQWHAIFDQEKLPSAFTVDLHTGKSFQLSRMSKRVRSITGTNTILNVSLGISNLLNNTNVIVRGAEQLRYDFTYYNPAKFANVYQYGFGINYFVNVSLKF